MDPVIRSSCPGGRSAANLKHTVSAAFGSLLKLSSIIWLPSLPAVYLSEWSCCWQSLNSSAVVRFACQWLFQGFSIMMHLRFFWPTGMCNPRNYNDSPATSKSTVEELYRPIPSLFRALTEGDAPINMMVVSFPVAEELSHHENLVSFLETLDSQSHNISLPSSSVHDGGYWLKISRKRCFSRLRMPKIIRHDYKNFLKE